MLENGYIKAFRAMLKWGWYKDVPCCKLWLHLLLCANYEPCVFEGKAVEAGQLITSYASLSEGSGLTVQQVRTALTKLKKTGEITVHTNRHYTLITIPKYSLYQQTDNRQITDNQQTDNKPITDQQQTDNRQITTMKESKKARKQESKKVIAPDREERFSKSVANAVSDWLAYKTERREGYKPVGLKSLLTEIEHQVQQHGDQAVCDVIRLSMANNWRGIVWDRIQQKQEKQNVFGNQLDDFDREWIERVRGHKS